MAVLSIENTRARAMTLNAIVNDFAERKVNQLSEQAYIFTGQATQTAYINQALLRLIDISCQSTTMLDLSLETSFWCTTAEPFHCHHSL